METVENSLSILLPVCNVESTLQRDVTRLLDMATTLTGRFEVVIVDDASTDHTVEVAYDLQIRYPQVIVVRNSKPRGIGESLRRAMLRSSGDVICAHEGNGPIHAPDVHQLWQLREQEDIVLARRNSQQLTMEDAWLSGMFNPALSRHQDRMGAGFQMLRRASIEALESDQPLQATHTEIRTLRTDRQTPQAAKPPRPNYLERIRQFARGE